MGFFIHFPHCKLKNYSTLTDELYLTLSSRILETIEITSEAKRRPRYHPSYEKILRLKFVKKRNNTGNSSLNSYQIEMLHNFLLVCFGYFLFFTKLNLKARKVFFFLKKKVVRGRSKP